MTSINALTISNMVARQKIYDVLMRYCRAVDRCDLELLRSVYHPGAYDDHGFFKGDAQDFAETLLDTRAHDLKFSMHFVGNVLIEVDGDSATSESYFMATQKRSEWTDQVQFFCGRYLDIFECRKEQWAIVDRRVVHDWSLMAQSIGSTPIDISQFATGASNPEDPSYNLGNRGESGGRVATGL